MDLFRNIFQTFKRLILHLLNFVTSRLFKFRQKLLCFIPYLFVNNGQIKVINQLLGITVQLTVILINISREKMVILTIRVLFSLMVIFMRPQLYMVCSEALDQRIKVFMPGDQFPI